MEDLLPQDENSGPLCIACGHPYDYHIGSEACHFVVYGNINQGKLCSCEGFHRFHPELVYEPHNDKLLELEERLKQVEWQLGQIQNRTCLRRGISIGDNVDLWFNTHRVLQVAQFRYELLAIGAPYTMSSIGTRIHRLYATGYLKRIGPALYVKSA